MSDPKLSGTPRKEVAADQSLENWVRIILIHLSLAKMAAIL